MGVKEILEDWSRLSSNIQIIPNREHGEKKSLMQWKKIENLKIEVSLLKECIECPESWVKINLYQDIL